MIKHCVFLSLRVSDDFSALDEPMRLLNELVGKIPGMLDFSHGPNLDYENKTTSYQYGFVSTFLDRAAHLEYEGHLDHE
ncbi:MAG: Dabb family protein, partial [Rhodospirillales bacterium]|nr:Dabb family protein [Rhodospirillales bacterium]